MAKDIKNIIRGIVNESYKGQKELEKFVDDFLMALTEKTIEIGAGSGISGIPSVNNLSITPDGYGVLKDFVSSVSIQLDPTISVISGKNSTKGQLSYDPKQNPLRFFSILLRYTQKQFFEINANLRSEKVDEEEILSDYKWMFASTLLHELQHAYDVWRSSGYAVQGQQKRNFVVAGIKAKELQNKDWDDLTDEERNVVGDWLKAYENLQHEINAKFAQTVKKLKFTTMDWESETLEDVMLPWEEVARSFRNKFRNWVIIEDRHKKRMMARLFKMYQEISDGLKEPKKLVAEEENRFSKILYHGSPKIFADFNNQTTFFTDSKKFAEDYSEDKSFAQETDESPNIYVVEVNTNLFDPENEEHLKMLEAKLPDSFDVYLTNFPIEYKMDKGYVLNVLQGYSMEQPYEEAVKAKVGDKIPDPSYKHETYTVFKRDDKYVYAYNTKEYNYAVSVMFKDPLDVMGAGYYYLKNSFKDINEFVENYAKEDLGKSYINNDTKRLYATAFNSNNQDRYAASVVQNPIPEDKLKEFHRLKEKALKDVEQQIIKEKYTKKFILQPEIIELKDTWRYFENDTVDAAIKELGFGGYVAKEKGVKTYAIFNPKKDVRIISYEFPSGMPFDSIDDYRKYVNYSNKAYQSSNKGAYWAGDLKIYRAYKEGIDPVVFAKNHDEWVKEKQKEIEREGNAAAQ